jgi:hypothetical protein
MVGTSSRGVSDIPDSGDFLGSRFTYARKAPFGGLPLILRRSHEERLETSLLEMVVARQRIRDVSIAPIF